MYVHEVSKNRKRALFPYALSVKENCPVSFAHNKKKRRKRSLEVPPPREAAMPAPRASRQRGVPVAPRTRAAGNPSSTCSSVNVSTRPSACRMVVVVRVRLRPSITTVWLEVIVFTGVVAAKAVCASFTRSPNDGSPNGRARAPRTRRRRARRSPRRARARQRVGVAEERRAPSGSTAARRRRRGHPRTGPGLRTPRGTPRTGRDGARTRPRTRTRRRKETRACGTGRRRTVPAVVRRSPPHTRALALVAQHLVRRGHLLNITPPSPSRPGSYRGATARRACGTPGDRIPCPRRDRRRASRKGPRHPSSMEGLRKISGRLAVTNGVTRRGNHDGHRPPRLRR